VSLVVVNIKQARVKCEKLIYDCMSKLDPTGQNTEFYKKKFAKMNDKQFYDFFNQDFPLKFQTKVFEVDPKIEDIIYTLENILKVPVTEEVNMPFYYTNQDGVPVKTKPALVVYLPLKRLKQMVQKKQGFSVNISKRDYRTGLLIDIDKNGNSTDREFESLVVYGLDHTLSELSTYRADAMQAKSKFYGEVNAKGMVSQSEVEVETSDSIARNLISSYLLGCHINSNLINQDCFLPRTLQKKHAGQSGLSRD
jgi:hypothetical protein